MKKPLKNALAAFVTNLVAVLIGFVAQRVFVSTLGVEFLGLNSLFGNIISMLGVAELGIGSAIIYNLYAPIKRKEKTKITALMQFYKRAYRWIGCAIAGLGAILMLFLPLFISGNIPDTNIYAAFLLFLLDTVCQYLLVYRRNILYASQEGYLVSIVHIGYLLLMNTAQVAMLMLTRNYYLYLIVRVVAHILENLVIHVIVHKKYPYLGEKTQRALPKEIKEDIAIKTKALLFHRFAGFIISGTDNIIISMFLGLVSVGLYSNYAVIFTSAEAILGQAITALIPTVGHLLVDRNRTKNFIVFKKLRHTTFMIASVSAFGILVLATPFVKIWLGTEYVLPMTVLLILVINYFQRIMRTAYMTFKEAAGIYHEDRFVPLIESLVNIVASVILVQLIGLPGVFIGTILSSLVLWCFSYPKFVYKPLFGRSYRQYALETGAYFAIFAITIIPVFLLLTK